MVVCTSAEESAACGQAVVAEGSRGIAPGEGADMGRFTYETTTKADFEDRLPAHLQIVIGVG